MPCDTKTTCEDCGKPICMFADDLAHECGHDDTILVNVPEQRTGDNLCADCHDEREEAYVNHVQPAIDSLLLRHNARTD